MNDAAALREHLLLTAHDLVDQFLHPLAAYPDEALLQRLGAGTLVIDLNTASSTHDGRPTPDLLIAGYLHLWLRESLVKAHLTKTAAERAVLVVHVQMERYKEQRDLETIWNQAPTAFVGVRATAECHLVVDGCEVSARGEDAYEWAATEEA